MSAVTKLREQEAPEVPATPALGFSIQVDVGGGRTAVLQTHLPNDTHLGDLNGMLAKMCDAGDRLEARYKLRESRRSLETEEHTLGNLLTDLERLAADWQRGHDGRLIEATAAQAKFDARHAEEYEASTDRRGHRASPEVKRLAAEAAKLKDAVAKGEAEHAQEVAKAEAEVARWRTQLELRRAEIAKLEALTA